MSVPPIRRLGFLGLVLVVVAAGCAGGGTSARDSSASLVVTETEDGDARVRATLANDCVRAGGEQTLTMRVESGVGVQYASTYADGESGREPPHGGGYGGVGGGLSADGVLEESWTVSEEAPDGLVVVYANALLPEDAVDPDPDKAFTRLRLSFLLLDPEEECPTGDLEIPSRPRVVTETEDAERGARVTLAHECVQAGERQTLMLESKAPGTVNFNTIYANGENGRPRPNGGGYGGSGFGVVGDEEAELAWSIEEEAPPGVAVVLVKVSATGDQTGEDVVSFELAFRVAGSEGECP